MKITVLCVGKIKEKFYTAAVEEYVKRLSRYSKVEIAEVQDEKTVEGASEKEEERVRDIEGKAPAFADLRWGLCYSACHRR